VTKTADDLVKRVMQKLTNLPPGEDPSAEDNQFITESWKSINENLRSPIIKISFWTFDAIPPHVFEPLCQYVKEMLWEEYHGARDNNTAICEAALNKVRMAVAMPYMGGTQQAEYF
jgi:hypothetical protein